MKIGIIGAGNLGVAIGARLAAKGHDILVSFARTPEKVNGAAARIGGGARAAAPLEAAQHGEVVLLATPWAVTLDEVARLAPALDGKIVWDTTNPLAPDMQSLVIGTNTSAGEEVARTAPGARVVKAIAPFAEYLVGSEDRIDGRAPSVFVCGDDPEARAAVARLVADIGADPVEAGPLSLARGTEPFGLLQVRMAYLEGFGPNIGTAFLR